MREGGGELLVAHAARRAALPDDQGVEPQLLLRDLEHLLLDRVLRTQTIHVHLVLLTDAVCAVHGLQVHLRVPVGVEQDHGVGSGQVDAEPARTRGQQEEEHAVGPILRALLELLHDLPALGAVGVAVNAPVRVLAHEAIVLQDVEQRRHLREDQDLGAPALE